MAETSINATAHSVAIVPAGGRQYPTTAAEYTPLSQLGEGSFGKVYLMQVQRTGELVAVKKVPLEDPGNEDGLEEALSEIALLMQHNSPRLVRMLATFVSRASLWIVMEYLAGNSCYALLKAGVFTEPQVAAVCKALLEALDYVHVRAQQIHRDLKGANVLLAEDGRVCLGDFGVGAQLNHCLSQHHTQTGTPFWMAPEVITEQGYDARADIWSLGITAIELAKGAPPHSGFNPLQIIPLVPKAAPPVLNKPDDVTRFSAPFRDFVAQCLIKDPGKRPTAAQLRKHPFIQNAGLDTQLLTPVIAKYRAWKTEQEGDACAARLFDITSSTVNFTQGPSWSFSTHTHAHLDTSITGLLAAPPFDPEEDGDDLSDDSSIEAQEELDKALASFREVRLSTDSAEKGTARPARPACLGHHKIFTGENTLEPTLLSMPQLSISQLERHQRAPDQAGQNLVQRLLPVVRKHQQISKEGFGARASPEASRALQTIESGLQSLVQANPARAYDLIIDWGLILNDPDQAYQTMTTNANQIPNSSHENLYRTKHQHVRPSNSGPHSRGKEGLPGPSPLSHERSHERERYLTQELLFERWLDRLKRVL